MKQGQAARLRRSSPRDLTLKLAGRTKAIWVDQRGVAAVEFGFFAIFLSFALANVTDVSIYVYQRMQVDNATQVAAQAALKTCSSKLPATTSCTGLTTAVNNALGSTSLGASVSLISGSPSEGYYCVNSSNALQLVNAVTSPKPADCTAAGTPSLQPGDYIQVQTTFSYTPLFGRLSVASAFATPITSSAMLRLG